HRNNQVSSSRNILNGPSKATKPLSSQPDSDIKIDPWTVLEDGAGSCPSSINTAAIAGCDHANIKALSWLKGAVRLRICKEHQGADARTHIPLVADLVQTLLAKAAARTTALSFILAAHDFFDACVRGVASLSAASATIMANDIAAGGDVKAATHPGVIIARAL
nr:mediator of RNA polymerase II transcription subunit 12 [Tanacetum cinerariifolium]